MGIELQKRIKEIQVKILVIEIKWIFSNNNNNNKINNNNYYKIITTIIHLTH